MLRTVVSSPTSLRHIGSPQCTGGGLHGDLVLTMVELSSTSKQCLARHTIMLVMRPVGLPGLPRRHVYR